MASKTWRHLDRSIRTPSALAFELVKDCLRITQALTLPSVTVYMTRSVSQIPREAGWTQIPRRMMRLCYQMTLCSTHCGRSGTCHIGGPIRLALHRHQHQRVQYSPRLSWTRQRTRSAKRCLRMQRIAAVSCACSANAVRQCCSRYACQTCLELSHAV